MTGLPIIPSFKEFDFPYFIERQRKRLLKILDFYRELGKLKKTPGFPVIL